MKHKIQLSSRYLFAVCLLFLATLHNAPMAQEALVDINTADTKVLAKRLKGVGPRLAKRIVDFREKHGPFPTVEALIEVKGIGNRVLERNRKILTASDERRKKRAGS